LVETAQAVGFSSVIDLTSAYDGLDPASLAVDCDDFHPNVLGHVVLARQLDRALSGLPEIARILDQRSSRVPSPERSVRRTNGTEVHRLERNVTFPLAARGGSNL
jgi:hypothetical protein